MINSLFCVLFAQGTRTPACRYVTRHPDIDGYSILIVDNDTMVALSEDRIKEYLLIKNSLDSARQVIKLKDSLLLEPSRNVVAHQDTVIRNQKEIIEVQTSLIEYYRKQVKLSSILKPRNVSIEVGGGLSGEDTNPLLSLGIAIKRVKLLAFGQKNNSGGMIMVSIPLN
jgi:hypothetical protein